MFTLVLTLTKLPVSTRGDHLPWRRRSSQEDYGPLEADRVVEMGSPSMAGEGGRVTGITASSRDMSTHINLSVFIRISTQKYGSTNLSTK